MACLITGTWGAAGLRAQQIPDHPLQAVQDCQGARRPACGLAVRALPEAVPERPRQAGP